MKKQRCCWVLFALISLMLGALACNGGVVDDKGQEAIPPPQIPQPAPTTIPPQVSDTPTHTPEPKPTDTPGPTNTPGPSGCSDGSVFIAETVPDNTEVAPGQAFTKIWRIQNNGSCTWTTGYQFVLISGEQMGAPQSVHLPQDVPPGATYDVSVTFTAPMAPGTYRSTWQLRTPEGALFGTKPYVQIVVPAPTATPTPTPIPTPTEGFEDTVEDLKDKLGLSLGLAPPPFDPFLICPDTPSRTPAITGVGASRDHGRLCLYGFPLDEEIVVDLYMPSGELVGSGVFRVVENGMGHLQTYQIAPPLDGSPVVGSAEERDAVTYIAISIWLPAGMPTGEWVVVANSDSVPPTESSFEVKYHWGATISTMPDTDINPFEDYCCGSYSVGEQVIVRGTNFDPDIKLPLGIYYLSASGFTVQGSQVVQVDSQGDFSTVVHVESSELRTYYIIAIIDSDAEGKYILNWYHPRVACYEVPEVPPGTVVGRVLWNEQPVEGAHVVIKDEYTFDSETLGETYTDPAGQFSISDVPSGQHVIYTIKPDDSAYWVWATQVFNVREDVGSDAGDIYLCRGFEISFPPDGGVVTDEGVVLSWPSYPDADFYEARVSDVAAGSFVFTGQTDSTSIAVDPPLASNRDYRWRVDGFNAAGHIIACSYLRSFSVQYKAPEVPPGTVVGRVLWNEQPVEGAHVVIKDEYSFDSETLGEAHTDPAGQFSIPDIPSGQHVIYTIKPDDSAYWVWATQVFNISEDVGSDAGDIYLCRGFEISFPPNGGTVTDGSVVLSWPSYPDADFYEARVSDAAAGSFVFTGQTDSTSIAVDPPLASNRDYHWRVDGFNAAGHIIACSYLRSFSVQ